MTIDSKYLGGRLFNIAPTEANYTFEYESIGEDSMDPKLRVADLTAGEVVYLDIPPMNYDLLYGAQPPIYSRGVFTYFNPETYGYETKLYIGRKTPILQELDLIPYTPAPMESVEFGLDKLTMILQEIEGDKCDCPGGTGGNPPPEPPVPIECRPYSCSALVGGLFSQGVPYTLTYTSGGVGTLEYPFSQDGSDGKFRYYNEFIAAPTLITGFGQALEESDGVLSGINSPDFCEGQIQHLLNINGDLTIGPDALVPPDNSWWGSSKMSMLIVGYNGSQSLSGVTHRNTAYRYTCNYGTTGGTRTLEDPDFVGVTLSGSGNDVTVTVSILNNVENFPDHSDSILVSGVADKLTLYESTISAGAPYEAQDPNDEFYRIVRDVTVTATYGGQTVSLTAVQSYPFGFSSGPNAITNLTQVANTLYTIPRAFYTTAYLSVAYISWGLAEEVEDVDLELALARNYVDYELPPYC